jgi:hypothetical protein
VFGFIAAMIAGMIIHDHLIARHTRSAAPA